MSSKENNIKQLIQDYLLDDGFYLLLTSYYFSIDFGSVGLERNISLLYNFVFLLL